MLKKIISDGQTGAHQGALDAAINLNIPYRGLIPKEPPTRINLLSDKYNLQEIPTSSYPERTEQNVIDSDGTLILSHGKLTGESKITKECAERHVHPCLHIDLYVTSSFEAALRIATWIGQNNIEILNVAGPRASKDPEIYQKTLDIIESVYHLCLMHENTPEERTERHIKPPETVDEAVDRLISELPLKDKATVANMIPDEMELLNLSLGNYIKKVFKLWTGNESLVEFCRVKSGKRDISENDASHIIIEALWERLRETHKLRVVK